MYQHVKLGLLLVVSMAVTQDVKNYKPKLATGMLYNATDKTFVLEWPGCIFLENTTNVWVVVARNKSYSDIDDSSLGEPIKYLNFINNNNNYYHTLLVSAGQYTCQTNNSTKNVIHIGCESCTETAEFCNGKLSNNDSYRVRFVVVRGSAVVHKTQWSDDIPLVQDKSVLESAVWPSGRSGGMIVLTTILCILLAILLVLLIIALVVGSKDICWKQTLYKEKSMAAFEYITHSSYKPYRNEYDHIILTS
ncbi:uroplakin-3b-like [Bufo gargarizans]|uniref:uroplakin-3b-like n=1 Tax=Bufo gargarizans TaxID=30331 RepID=UPI001CF1E800|nr:uroplakin-3b-like [Bufo gargarizans]